MDSCAFFKIMRVIYAPSREIFNALVQNLSISGFTFFSLVVTMK